MTVYLDKLRKVWRYDFQLGGQRYWGDAVDPITNLPAPSRRAAKAVEDDVRATARKKPKQGPAVGIYVVAMLFTAYASRTTGGRTWNNQSAYIKDLVAHFGPATDANEINNDDVWEYIKASRLKKKLIYIGGSMKLADALKIRTWDQLWKESDEVRDDATINRYLDALRKAFGIARKTRDRITKKRLVPYPPDIPALEEPKRMPRPIPDSILSAIIQRSPHHLADACALDAHMGFRKFEVFGLVKQRVDEQNRGYWLPADVTKADRDEFVPANEIAMAILSRLKRQADEWKVSNLISYRPNGKGAPRPIKNPKRAFARVLKDLGLTGQYTFHNIKASYVSAIGANASGPTTQALARHRNFGTTQGYLEVADQAKRAAVNSISSREATAGFDVSISLGSIIQPKRGPSPTRKSHMGPMERQRVPSKLLGSLVGAAGFEPATPSPPEVGADKNVIQFKGKSGKNAKE